jgi:OmpA-OmpF porin, OOP family
MRHLRARARNRALRPSLSFIVALLASCLSLPALAQPRAEGFALDRYEPSERGSEWFALDSLDLRGHLRPALGIVADYGYKPLVIYDADGNEVAPLVEHQLFLHAGVSLVVWERLRVAASLPFTPFVRGDGALVGMQQYNVEDEVALGDLRLSADVRLFGRHRGPVTGALGVSVWLPTGKRGSYSGDESVRVSPHFLLSGDVSLFTYAARVGFVYRARNGDFSGSAIGSEVSFGAAAGLRVDQGRLVIGPEVYGSTVVEGGVFRKRGTPLEAIFGAHYTIANQVRLGAGAGAGLTQGFGSPEVRALASVEWAPGHDDRTDRDQDGIFDEDDACPDVKGLPNADPKKNGCPDRDGDGIIDQSDACPDEAGLESRDPAKNGCPDRDGDGVLDKVDACPDVKGVESDDPKTNGCPDSDGDSIFDPLDACPNAAGPANEDPKKHGCPPARIERGEIKIIEQVQFRTDSAEILPVSDGILTAVLAIFEKHPEITKVSVEGHTDNVGGAKYNKGLSERRVLSVLSWLTSHGVQPIRLTSAGFGLERPIASNDSEEGRAQNRRVEFHIREVDGKPTDADGKPLDAEQE